MLRIVKAELYKLFKNRTFKVLCGVAIVMSMLTILMASPLFEKLLTDSLGDMSPEEQQIMLEQLGSVASSEQIVVPGQMGVQITAKDPMNPTALEIYHSSFGAGLLEILAGILIAAFLAKEYSQGTIKNTLAYGKKRYEFYLAKFLALVVGVTVITGILTIVSTTGAVIISGWGEAFEMSQVLGMLKTFIASIFANSAVIAVIMIFAILVKSNGATIAVTAGGFILLPSIAAMAYGVYPWYDKVYELTPFYNSALATSVYAGNGDLMRAVIVATVTIGVALLAGIQIFKAQDIK